MKKIITLILISAGIVSAQSNISSGLSFLKFGFGAKNISMGDLGVVTGNDVSALNYNPALLTQNPNAEISFTHNNSVQDLRSEMLGVKFNFLNLPMAVGVNTTSISDIEVRRKPGEPESNFSANYFWGSLSTAFNVYKNLSLGITAKYIYESLFTEEAMGYGIDLGTYYNNIIPNLSAGVSVKNLGSMNKFKSESTELPVEFNAGLKYLINADNINSNFTVAAGYKNFLNDEADHFAGAFQWMFKDIIAIRGGYISGFESKNLTVGIGINWNSLVFDYAYVPYEYNLGNSNTISLKYIF